MKHPLSAIVLAHGLAITLGGTAFAQTTADIQQTGHGNAAYAEQANNAGDNVAANIVQSGYGNRAGNPDSGSVSLSAGGILQSNNRGHTTAQIRQEGNGNLGMVTQEGVTGKFERVSQSGYNQTGTLIEQGGSGGGAAIAQYGIGNAAAVTLTGNDGVVDVIQSSQSNKAEVTHASSGKTSLQQSGAYNTATVDNQHANGNLKVEQTGSSNFANATSPGLIVQTGRGNSASLSGTDNLVINPVFYNTQGYINQYGIANSASISQKWSAGNGVASIDQFGTANTASLTTLGRHGGIVKIKQNGNDHIASVDQGAFTASNVSVDQEGTGHKANISQRAHQFGLNHTEQKGAFNVATVTNFATGSGDESIVLQDGLRNQALISQTSAAGFMGDANKATIQQQGNDFQATIYQAGAANRAAIRQR